MLFSSKGSRKDLPRLLYQCSFSKAWLGLLFRGLGFQGEGFEKAVMLMKIWTLKLQQRGGSEDLLPTPIVNNRRASFTPRAAAL